MLIYLVDLTFNDISTDEKTREEIPFALEKQSLTELEEVISQHAMSCYSTYVIHSIRYLGYPFKKIIKQ
jgi:hypothetical protein